MWMSACSVLVHTALAPSDRCIPGLRTAPAAGLPGLAPPGRRCVLPVASAARRALSAFAATVKDLRANPFRRCGSERTLAARACVGPACVIPRSPPLGRRRRRDRHGSIPTAWHCHVRRCGPHRRASCRRGGWFRRRPRSQRRRRWVRSPLGRRAATRAPRPREETSTVAPRCPSRTAPMRVIGYVRSAPLAPFVHRRCRTRRGRPRVGRAGGRSARCPAGHPVETRSPSRARRARLSSGPPSHSAPIGRYASVDPTESHTRLPGARLHRATAARPPTAFHRPLRHLLLAELSIRPLYWLSQ